MVDQQFVEQFVTVEDKRVKSDITNEEVRIRKFPEDGREGYQVGAVDRDKPQFSDDRGTEMGFSAFDDVREDEDEGYFTTQEKALSQAQEMGVGYFGDQFFSASVSPTAPSTDAVEPGVQDVEEGDVPVSVGVGRGIREFHSNRSERARDVDNQRRAEITTDQQQWLEHPDRYDFPGVDTPTANNNQYGADDVLTVEESDEGALPVPWFLR